MVEWKVVVNGRGREGEGELSIDDVSCREVESGGSIDKEVAADDKQGYGVTHVNKASRHMLGMNLLDL